MTMSGRHTISRARRAGVTRPARLLFALALLGLCALPTGGCGNRSRDGAYTVKFRTIPAEPTTGPVHLIFEVRDPSGHPVKAKAVDVVAKIPPRPPLPEMEITDPASEESAGNYGIMMSLAARGQWSIGATVRDQDKVLATGVFTIDVR